MSPILKNVFFIIIINLN